MGRAPRNGANSGVGDLEDFWHPARVTSRRQRFQFPLAWPETVPCNSRRNKLWLQTYVGSKWATDAQELTPRIKVRVVNCHDSQHGCSPTESRGRASKHLTATSSKRDSSDLLLALCSPVSPCHVLQRPHPAPNPLLDTR